MHKLEQKLQTDFLLLEQRLQTTTSMIQSDILRSSKDTSLLISSFEQKLTHMKSEVQELFKTTTERSTSEWNVLLEKNRVENQTQLDCLKNEFQIKLEKLSTDMSFSEKILKSTLENSVEKTIERWNADISNRIEHMDGKLASTCMERHEQLSSKLDSTNVLLEKQKKILVNTVDQASESLKALARALVMEEKAERVKGEGDLVKMVEKRIEGVETGLKSDLETKKMELKMEVTIIY